MGKINVLSFAVANLIAAGEVVERPASVIKELVENSIDSGANKITIEIQNGGVTYMRVTDNGCGMDETDLPVAIRRHATSKISEAEDLENILTLGFRGEALAAIASVSTLRIISKTANSEYGAMLESDGGENIHITQRGSSDGTTVIVENLFANVPARRKFLKRDATEAMAICAIVEKIALSSAGISFTLIVDGTLKLETAGDGILKSAIYALYGKSFVNSLVEIDGEIEQISVKGYVGRPDNVKANRNYQNFFINHRYVKSKTACAALEQAFSSYCPPEKFPCCIINIEIPPNSVDINVHPTKLEVKFSNEKMVFEAVYYTVRAAIEKNNSRPNFEIPIAGLEEKHDNNINLNRNAFVKMSSSFAPVTEVKGDTVKERQISYSSVQPKQEAFVKMTAQDYANEYVKEPYVPKQTKKDELIEEKNTEANNHAFPLEEKSVSKKIDSPEQALDQNLQIDNNKPIINSYRFIGEVFNTYILVEKEDKLLLIDKHAAHERIIFEDLKKGIKSAPEPCQILMIPIEVMLTNDEIGIINDYKAEIEATGFAFTTGKNTVFVNTIPANIKTDAVEDIIMTIVDRIKNTTGDIMLTKDIVFEKALYQASCKAAIKGGRMYADEHIEWIIDKLMKIPDITVCPHGRPVAMELSKRNVDKQFMRIL